MPSPKISQFSAFSFSEEELLSASILSPIQIQLIQTDMAQIAENILALEYDPLNPQSFVQNDAHLKGQLASLKYLLLRSEESEYQLKMRTSSTSQAF